jgi:starch phosphorylase
MYCFQYFRSSMSAWLNFHRLSGSSMRWRVELYANRVTGDPPVRHEMKRTHELVGASAAWVYSAAVSAARPARDYTARVIPHHDGVAIPLEDQRILWQR